MLIQALGKTKEDATKQINGGSKVDIERFKKFRFESEVERAQLDAELNDVEARGWTLTTLEVEGQRYDEATDETLWETVTVRNAQTKEVLGVFNSDEFSTLDYNRQRWFDAQHHYE